VSSFKLPRSALGATTRHHPMSPEWAETRRPPAAAEQQEGTQAGLGRAAASGRAVGPGRRPLRAAGRPCIDHGNVVFTAATGRSQAESASPGEDPYLVGAMSVAFTRGMQSKDLREGVLVCAKHFLGCPVTEGGQNMAATAIGPRELYDVNARPFEAAIRLAGLAGVMATPASAASSTP
jgi:Glycosyl hydrolase family 3 N terminal domain